MPTGADFSRVNVIYGGNGSGKSTLARVFATMTEEGRSDDVAVDADVSEPDGKTRRVADRADNYWSRVRVFNKEFVSRNLSFDVEGRSDARPLLVLGEPNVERDNRLVEIKTRLEAIHEQQSDAQQASSEATNAANKLATDTARTISQELQAAGGRYESRRYDARQLKKVLNAIDPEADRLSDSAMAADLGVVQGQRRESVSLIQRATYDLNGLEQQVIELLAQTITSTPLDELAGNPNAEQWVARGLELHEHRDECLFCAQPVSAERRRALERHFDESFKTLQNRLNELDRRLQGESEAVSEAYSSAPDRDRVYSDLQADYARRMGLQEEAVAEYQERIESLRSALGRKRDSPFTAINSGVLPGRAEVDFAHVNELLEQHNARSTDYERAVADAASRVERARAAEIADDYRNHEKRAEEARGRVATLEEERKGLAQEYEDLNTAELHASPLAEELTRDVAVLLGRDELVFASQDGRYSIERHGKPATALSEGERTAISLLYFLCSLRDERNKDPNATVIIDDPVSSLDHEILVGASSYLWSRLLDDDVKYQVLLLTHSFEFFRMWSNQLDRRWKGDRKSCPHAIFELRNRYEVLFDGSARRRPQLLSWDNKSVHKELRSQYYYLFCRVADVVREGSSRGDLAKEMEAAGIIPNATRQMLEAFLAFKYPSKIGSFEGSVHRAFEEWGVADPLRQRMTRFLHGQSHNEEPNIDKPTGIGESITVLKSVFQFIRAIDEGHFEEMCKALGIPSDELIA